jgi:hypothetical protein
LDEIVPNSIGWPKLYVELELPKMVPHVLERAYNIGQILLLPLAFKA